MSLVLSPRRAILMPGPWVRDELWRRARAVPSLDLRFADSKSLIDVISGLQLITFTRASSGTFVGSGGLVETAGTNVPRFDHNPITGECLGLLVEEQRTNLLLHSRTLTNVAWVATNITPAKNQTGADGVGNSASSITATAANGTILQTVTSASAARATSAYVKRITGSGTIEMTQNGGTTWTAVTVTSSWSRVSIPSATVTNPSVGFRIATSGDAIAVDYVQCETGAFVTSAIETTTAAVTRNADVVSITGTNFSSWYRQDEGTMFVAGVSNGTNDAGFFTLEDGSLAEYIRMNTAFNLLNFLVSKASGPQANIYSTGTSFLFGSSFRGVGAYASNDVGLSLNGSNTQVDTTANMPDAANVLRIGFGKYTTYANGTLRRLTFWPQRLSNPTLQTLTR